MGGGSYRNIFLTGEGGGGSQENKSRVWDVGLLMWNQNLGYMCISWIRVKKIKSAWGRGVMDKKNWGWVDGNTSGWDLVEENKSGEGGGGSWSENIGDISDRVKKIKLGTGLGGGGG